jgi:hypothetical protein
MKAQVVAADLIDEATGIPATVTYRCKASLFHYDFLGDVQADDRKWQTTGENAVGGGRITRNIRFSHG